MERSIAEPDRVRGPAGGPAGNEPAGEPAGAFARRPAGERAGKPAGELARELARVLRLGGPIVLSQLGIVGMTTADTLLVGPLGAVPLAAAGLGSAIHLFALLVALGFVFGTGPLISQAYGAGDEARCRAVLVQALWLAALLSVPVMLVSFVGSLLARALGQPPEVVDLAARYLAALAWGVPAWMGFMAFRQYLEGLGRPGPATVLTLFGLGLNVVADLALIYGVRGFIPALGVVGAGWATTLVRWAMLIALLGYLLRHPRLHPFRGMDASLRPELLRRILRVGLPVGGQLGVEMGFFASAAVMMGWLGPVPLAAHQIAINIASTTFMVPLGLSMAGSVRVGHHIGARRPEGVRRAVVATYLLCVGFMACCALGFLAAPRALVGLYTSDPAVLELGTTLLLAAAAFQVFDGAQVAGLSVLRGAADTLVPMAGAAAAYLAVGWATCYLLGFHAGLGAAGVWAGLCVALAAAALFLAARVRRVLWTPIPEAWPAPARA